MNGKLITRVLLVALSLVFVVTAFASCDNVATEEFGALQTQVDELKNQVNSNGGTLETLETKEVVAELRALAEQIKLTADAAATQAAFADAKAALEAADTDNKAALEKALADAKAALEKVDADNKASAEAALADVKAALEAADADNKVALESALANAVATLDSAYKAADNTVTDSLAALKTRVDAADTTIGNLNTATAANAAEVEALKAELVTIKSQLAALTDISDAANNAVSAAEFELATKILVGEATLEDFASEEEYNRYKDLTLVNFEATLKTITDKASWYEGIGGVALEDYKSFDAETKNIEFFLNRATSKEVVEELFAKLDDAIAALKPVDVLFNEAVDAIINGKKVTDSADSYAVATSLKAELDEAAIAPEYLAKYSLIVDAQENLAAAIAAVAGDVVAYIDIIDIDGIVYTPAPVAPATERYAVVEAARKAFDDFNALYFGDAEIVALYDEATYTAMLLTSNYDVLVAAEERVAELDAAMAAKPEIIDVVANFAAVRPLWTDYEAINALDSAIEAWIAEYSLDAANIDAIFGNANMELVDTALKYASDMKGFYDTYNAAGALRAFIEDINDDALMLYSKYDAFVDARNNLVALREAIENCDNYDATLDANFDGMIGIENAAKFESDAVSGQMDRLNAAYVAIRGEGQLFDQMKAIEVGYYVAQDMLDKKADLDEICTVAGIAEGDENYALFVEEVVTFYNEWMTKYDELTAEIARIYQNVIDAMKGNFGLSRGNEIDTTNALIDELPGRLGVGNIDISLTLNSGVGYDVVNLKDMVLAWNNFVVEFKLKAADAQADAVVVNNAIEAILGKSNDLNKREAILAAQTLYNEWADNYLLADETVASVQGISVDSVEYAFVTVENYNEMLAEVAASDARLEAAKADFDVNVKPAFDAVAVWDIHSGADFRAANAAWTAYVAEYYIGGVTANAGEGFYGEVAAYTDMKADEADFDVYMVDVKALNSSINEAIANVLADTTSSASDIKATIANIRTNIETFESLYGCDKYTCESTTDTFRISDADQLALAKKEATAKITVEIDDALVQAGGDISKAAAVENIRTTFVRQLNAATTVAMADNAYAFASSTLVETVAGWTSAS